MGIGRFAFTPLLPLMQERLGVSLLEGGWLASANYLGYLAGALCCVAAGHATQRLARLGIAGVALLDGRDGLRRQPGCLDRVALLSPAWRARCVFIGVSAWALSLLNAAAARPAFGLDLLRAWGSASRWPAWSRWASERSACIRRSVGWRSGSWRRSSRWRCGSRSSIAPTAGAASTTAATAPARLGRDGWRLVVCYGAFGFGYIIPATFLPAAARAVVNDPAVFGWTWPVFGALAALSTVFAATLWRNAAPRTTWATSQLVMAAGVLAPALAHELCCAARFGRRAWADLHGDDDGRHAGGTPRRGGAGAPRLIAAMTTAMAFGQLIGPVTVRGRRETACAEAIRAAQRARRRAAAARRAGTAAPAAHAAISSMRDTDGRTRP